MTRRTLISSPQAERSQSPDFAREAGLVKELAGERVRQLRASILQLRAAQRRLAASGDKLEDQLSYKDHFRFAPDGYLVTDVRGKILEANVAAARLFNVPEHFVAGKPLTLYVAPEQRKAVCSRLGNIEPSRAAEWHMDLVPRSGTTRIVHATVSAEPTAQPGRGKLRWLLRDVTDQSRREQTLLAEREGLSTLASQLTLAQERERRRIATEIHDHIGQSLAFCQLRLGMLRESLGADEQTVVDEVRSLLSQVIQQTRSLTFELSPTVLYELGLGPALEWLIDQRGHLGIAFRLETTGEARRLDRNIEITLFEAVREVLSNVIKHSRASKATVRLTYAPRAVSVEVQDDGTGFNLDQAAAARRERSSLGLLSVRERMEFLGGTAEIHSEPGRGSRVRLTVPLHARTRERTVNEKASE